MQTNSWFQLFVVLLLLMLAACTSTHQDTVQVIPMPMQVVEGTGLCRLDGNLEVKILDSRLHAMELDQRLAEVVRPSGLDFGRGGRPGGSTEIRLDLDGDRAGLGPEGYRLAITDERIAISAAEPVGVFYGIQTLKQLLPDPNAAGDWAVPYLIIVDRPRFPWRGQLLDVSRHFLPVDFVKKNIDYLASLKMNVFHWHLTDDQGWRVPVEEYPKLTSVGAWRVDRNDEPWGGRLEQQPGEKATYGGFYTRDEIREVIEYARLRGITVMPEIDMPGHSRAAIAAYPEISCDNGHYTVATGGVMSENTYCPGKEETFRFMETVLNSVMDLFPSEYIHIGGDECNKHAWKECEHCRKRMQTEGLADVEELQSYFIKRAEKIINERGRKMIGWDEILEGGLAPNAAVMSWRGTSGGITAAKAGHEVVMTPGSHCYLDLKQGNPETEPDYGYSQLLLSTAYSHEPIPETLSEEQGELVLGIQGNLWGESIQSEYEANYMLFPRLFAIADVAWAHPPRQDWRGFTSRLEKALARLTTRNIRWAPSMYQVDIAMNFQKEQGGVVLTMTTEHDGVPIRYTLDGSEPDEGSPLYVRPVLVTKTTRVHAASFRNGKRLGRVTADTAKIFLSTGKEIRTAKSWSDKYKADGKASLVDGQRGSVRFTDGRWLGYQAEDFVGMIDLGSSQTVNAAGLGCLCVQPSWIFFPTRIEVEVSEDGETFTRAGHIDIDAARRTARDERRDITVATNGISARYVRVTARNLMTCPEGHRGEGGRAWLFIDELIVR